MGLGKLFQPTLCLGRVVRDCCRQRYGIFPLGMGIILIRVKTQGAKDGCPAQALVNVVDKFDEAAGFTKMERTINWSAAILAEMIARVETPRDAGTVESFVVE